jgi:hypothetical protein
VNCDASGIRNAEANPSTNAIYSCSLKLISCSPRLTLGLSLLWIYVKEERDGVTGDVSAEHTHIHTERGMHPSFLACAISISLNSYLFNSSRVCAIEELAKWDMPEG